MNVTKTTLRLLLAAVLIMTLSLAILLPSGAITEQAHQTYQDALWEKEEDSLSKLSPVAVLATAAMSDILPVNDISALPVDNSPGRTPIADNYTETGYRDDTMIVELEQKRMFESDVFVAYVKIATPSQLRTAFAGSKISSTRTGQTSRIARNFNAVVAMNGDYYPNTKGGYIVRQGETFRQKTSKNVDLLFIDELGDFHTILRGHENQEAEIKAFQAEHEIVNGFFFGPVLVKDGAAQEIPEDYQFDPHSANPRAAIGQLAPLTYVMVTVNGRTEESAGVTMAELAQIMEELGCREAYNLDGGNSATLVFRGEVYNDKPQAERDVTDIIYFASATDSE